MVFKEAKKDRNQEFEGEYLGCGKDKSKRNRRLRRQQEDDHSNDDDTLKVKSHESG